MQKKAYIDKLIDNIKYPIITDKTTKNIENNVYYFKVNKTINKSEIKTAIEYIFDVKVEKINTINVYPKTKRLGKFTGKISQYKKAIVKLKKTYSINLFNNN
uniref:Large ribosomal subunit protein uL23c n=1 Tax=Lophocladia kuetzingii TaxID=675577 RepID=A0A1Z1MPB6_9FLOR|nr:ribosomal protein L23 [Lophocladia kuetzingii]ARW67699.1 ribosomal protein L23 [Lophocladia kuetzingii]